MSTKYCYSNRNNVPLYSKEPVRKPNPDNASNTLMLGTYMEITGEGESYYKVKVFDKKYWIDKKDTTTKNNVLKCFFVDVGQGDGMLIEVGNLRILIDGGKGKSLHSFLNKWKYKYLLDKGEKVIIDHLFITHLDDDHFKGFIEIFKDPDYLFKNVYFAGLIKYSKGKNTKLGDKVSTPDGNFITTLFDNIESIKNENDVSPLVLNLADSYLDAKSRNPMLKSKRLSEDDGVVIKEKIDGTDFTIEVLCPLVTQINSSPCLKWFTNESKTINGNSLVLKVTYGKRTILLGGDLNEEYEDYIISKHKDINKFKAEVYKSGHHGSRDFSINFLKKIEPNATIFSSGDNESYDHPSALALGCAGRYSKAEKPLVFSTELARSYSEKKIIFGLIFFRTNGADACFSLMKEKKVKGNPFAYYELEPTGE